MRSVKCCLIVAGVLMAVLSDLGCTSPRPAPPQGNHVSYKVKGGSVALASAVTPFDANAAARDAFLKWFKRGVEAGLKGESPMRVQWQPGEIGQAGSRGYDLGLEEGERLRKESAGRRGLQTTSIPPF